MEHVSNRIEVLHQMHELRKIGAEHAADNFKEKWKAAPDAEGCILEIAELAFVLQADGFLEREIFKRVGHVLDHLPRYHPGGCCRMLHDFIGDYLDRHAKDYLKLGSDLVSAAITIASLWAEIFAERMTKSRWPRQDQLEENLGRDMSALNGYEEGRMGTAD